MTFFTWVIVAGAIVSVSAWIGCWRERRAFDRSVDNLLPVLEKHAADMRENSRMANERMAVIESLATGGSIQVVFSHDGAQAGGKEVAG